MRDFGLNRTTLFVVTFVVNVSAAIAQAAPVDFNRDVRPILSNNCFFCHGPDKRERKAGLRLDTFDGATTDLGGHAAIVPGDPSKSRLLEMIHPDAEDDIMPPPESKKPPLTAADADLLRRWITEGGKYAGHWAFEPLSKVPPPQVDRVWPRNGIDQFILARFNRENIQPSPVADKETLLRRVSLDLVGLPPTPEQRRDFLADMRPDAWERLVDSLLESRHYGERWGRHWLDQARYADSHGYSIDGDRDMWPYRDWVIKALNDDMPFDQFTIEQLAGDLLPDATKMQRVASAFHRNTLINQEGGSDPEQFRVEAVMDRVNTTGAVWLGLTVGCAQCHSHKFDPISQREYYQLFAYFNSCTDKNNGGAIISVAEGEVFGEAPPPDPRPPKEKKGANKKKNKKKSGGQLMVMADLKEPRDTYLLVRGDFTRPDKEGGLLRPGVIKAMPPTLPETDTPTRLDLARWLVHKDNPLTPRVTVNRVWMRYFGRGIVETEEDFGTQGSYPTHPELLDWLARRFVENNWSMKKLHRLIVTSATYRQSSKARPDLKETDPRNLLWARQERLRLEGEILRDSALTASGLLHPKIGGPSVRPPQPDGVYAFTQNKKSWKAETGPDRYRRGLYTRFYRSAPYPLFSTFDAPDFQTVCTRRSRSNTPLQALTLANDPAFLELARALARRLATECDTLNARIERGFILTVNRRPEPGESRLLEDYARRQDKELAKDSKAAQALAGNAFEELSLPVSRAAALVCLARVLINTDNFITRE